MPFQVTPAALTAPGQSGIIQRFTNERLEGKLLDIGVRPGAKLTVVRKGPFGGSWYVKVDGRQCLALRRRELACILVG